MAEMVLKHGMTALVDDADLPLLQGFNWLPIRKRDRYYVYAYVPESGRKYMKHLALHRLLTNAPDGMEVDHINGNPLDNRRCNLRVCTRAENQRNRRPTGNTSSYKGVSWDSWAGKWIVRIRQITIGRYRDEVAAARAYDAAASEMYGEFARLNFPKEVS